MTISADSSMHDVLTSAGLDTMATDDGRWYHYVSDGVRTYTLTAFDSRGDFEIRHHTDYPEIVNHLFGTQSRIKNRLSQQDLTQLWRTLGDETVRLGYPRSLTGPAIVLYHEGHMMQAVHGNRREYTMLDCLRILTAWRPHFNFQQLGIMIDNNMSLDTILNLPEFVAFEYVQGLYPDVVYT